MATVLTRVPLRDINAQARDVEFGRTVLTILAAVLFGVGWLAAKTVGAVWLALAWSAVAVKVGWNEAHGSGRARGPA